MLRPRKFLLSAAQKGNAAAQFYVGLAYDEGTGFQQSYDLARQWYIRAAKQGFIAAQLYLGRIYELGLGVTVNYKETASWYTAAAQHGSPEGQTCPVWPFCMSRAKG